MPKKESFVLVSLKEDRAKQLAQAISNESCRKILDHLAEKEATESELSKLLNIPISTVHYNLQQLQSAGLVAADEFHYSEKGKEVNHYKLVNKYVIISPKPIFGIKEKLRSILPVVLIVGAFTAAIQFFSKAQYAAQSLIGGSAPEMLKSAAPVLDEAVEEAAATAADESAKALAENAIPAAATSIFQSIAIWFLIGALSALLIYLIVDWFRKR